LCHQSGTVSHYLDAFLKQDNQGFQHQLHLHSSALAISDPPLAAEGLVPTWLSCSLFLVSCTVALAVFLYLFSWLV
jgi:hypothetical protein